MASQPGVRTGLSPGVVPPVEGRLWRVDGEHHQHKRLISNPVLTLGDEDLPAVPGCGMGGQGNVGRDW